MQHKRAPNLVKSNSTILPETTKKEGEGKKDGPAPGAYDVRIHTIEDQVRKKVE